jgi:hypothetical protein
MSILVNNWTSMLTDAQRESWNTYAFNTPTLNKLGEATHKTGQQMYIRGNIPRLQASLEPISSGPIQFNVGSFTEPLSFSASGGTDTVSLPFAAGDEWAQEDNSAMLIYQSRPQNATRNFGKGPFQLASIIEGNQSIPPTSPKVFTSLFPLSSGQKLFLQIRVTRGDGRLSGKSNPTAIVGA